MGEKKKSSGRPKMETGKRYRFHNVRFSEEEFKAFEALSNNLNISKTELIRSRVLKDADKIVLNSKELLGYLDQIGADMSRIGNNINQLARHANILKMQQALNPNVVIQFEQLFEEYIRMQQRLEVSLRKIIRLMGK